MLNLNNFIEYIGPSNSLFGYNHSYKMLSLIHMLELVDSGGKMQRDILYRSIQQFYIDRNNNGLKAELDGSNIQKRINNLTVDTVKWL